MSPDANGDALAAVAMPMMKLEVNLPRLATGCIIIAVIILTSSSSVADTSHQFFLPLIHQSGHAGPPSEPTPVTPTPITPTPSPGTPTPPPGVRIFDRFGVEQDWDWVIDNYGAVEHLSQPGTASLVELREVEGPSTLIADVGQPGARVVFYWPDAPALKRKYWNCGLERGLIVEAKENGMAEFAMGSGSYYFPPIGGPHWIWVLGGSDHGDCLGGIGMLGLTNHRHLDSVWVLEEGR